MAIKNAPRKQEKKKDIEVTSRNLVKDTKGRIIFRDPRSEELFILPPERVTTYNILENRYVVALVAGFIGYSLLDNSIIGAVGIGAMFLAVMTLGYELGIRRGLQKAEKFTQHDFDRLKNKRDSNTKAEGVVGHIITLVAGLLFGVLLILNALQTPDMSLGMQLLHFALAALSFLLGFDGARKLYLHLRGGK